jgi:polyisoprenyl-phosphate glycosyltransferase
MMPVYEDWVSAAEVCRRIDRSIGTLHASVEIVLINDGSQSIPGQDFHSLALQEVHRISVLDLHRNLGHQRAIAIALAYAAAHLPADAIVLMDGDGEDPPEQIPDLVREAERLRFSAVVFAKRGRRVEGWLFRSFYLVYRAVHYILTGRGIAVGNFSVVPRRFLAALVVYPEIWNHYAAALLQSRLPRAMIRLDRGERIQGKSKMRFTDLLIHGLSALFAYHEVVSTRLLLGTVLLMFVSSAALVALLASTAISPSNKMAIEIALIMVVGQLSTLSLLVTFLTVMNRSAQPFLPARDWVHFVRGLTALCCKENGARDTA